MYTIALGPGIVLRKMTGSDKIAYKQLFLSWYMAAIHHFSVDHKGFISEPAKKRAKTMEARKAGVKSNKPTNVQSTQDSTIIKFIYFYYFIIIYLHVIILIL